MDDPQLAFAWDTKGPHHADAPPPAAQALAPRLAKLAARGIYLGTSSWKYPGWLGQLYRAERYHVRGKFSRKTFEKNCLAEYATIFPTVGGDFSFYQFPSPNHWRDVFAPLPDAFRFSLKVPDQLTIERYPNLPRYGRRAGEVNPHFLDAALLTDNLLSPLSPYRDRLGVLIFEFGAVQGGPMRDAERFAGALDRMFAKLPTDRFDMAVEVRNPDFADSPRYRDTLRARGVAHCFNSWTRMPPLHQQVASPELLTAGHVAARLLLKPGRSYQQAVDAFAPYERIHDPYPEGRAALRALIEACLEQKKTLFAFVNNRFEGNAVHTIQAVLDELDHGSAPRADARSAPATGTPPPRAVASLPAVAMPMEPPGRGGTNP